ncbi:hypothetical protein SteCoe_31557 [Stentor coeruleus]|uniref:Uncharacterized protein n=1 Tax=Stentor coeruleus TaxID=5963 RepID=A0A1R2B124_9CILI|nr:hypothetical protein SteCoe_31557 [Stentor coeruleus]
MSTLYEEQEMDSTLDGFWYTFENTLSFSSDDSEDYEDYEDENSENVSEEVDEGTANTVNQTSRLWKRGTLWVHDSSLIQ